MSELQNEFFGPNSQLLSEEFEKILLDKDIDLSKKLGASVEFLVLVCRLFSQFDETTLSYFLDQVDYCLRQAQAGDEIADNFIAGQWIYKDAVSQSLRLNDGG